MERYNNFQDFLSSLEKGSEIDVSLYNYVGFNGVPEYRSYAQIESGKKVLKLPEHKCWIKDSEKRTLVKIEALKELIEPLKVLKEIKDEMNLTIKYRA